MSRTLRRRLVVFLTVLTASAALVAPAPSSRTAGSALVMNRGMAGALAANTGTGSYGSELIPGCQWATWVSQCQNLNVYGNGNSFSDSSCGPPYGCQFGPEFQCTELAQRYAYYAWGEPANWYGYGGARGSAYQMWSAAPALPIGLQQFPQGGGVPPRVGDLMIFNQGWLGSYWDANGHVAVVSAVTATGVSIVQENGTATGTDTFGLSGSTVIVNGYTPVIGWLHNPLMGTSKLAVANSGSQQVAFWRGSDNHLHESWSQNGTWSGPVDWTAAWSTPTLVMSAPSVVASTTSALQTVFWRGDNGHLWEAAWNGGWSTPTDLSAAWSSAQLVLSAPSAIATADGQFSVFWEGVNGDLMEAWTSGGVWQQPADWTSSWGGAGSLTSSPSVAMTGSGQLLVFWQALNGHLWEAWYSNGWKGPIDLSLRWAGAGLMGSPPSAVVAPSGVESLLWEGTDGHMWGAWYDTAWHGPTLWDGVGTLTSGPSAVVLPNGTLTAYWQGGNGDLFSASRTDPWNGPVDLAYSWGGTGLVSGAPAAAVTPSGQQVVFWRGANAHLWETWYSAGAWSPPVDWTQAWSSSALLASSPTVAVGPDGTQLVFWQGTNGDLYEAWFHDGWNGPVDWTASWPGAQPLGSSPSVAMSPDGTTQTVFWRGTGGDLMEAWFAGSAWNGPVDWSATWGAGHALSAAPSVAFTPGGSQQVVAWKDTGGVLDEVWFSTSWNGPLTLGPGPVTLTSGPSLAILPSGRQDTFLRGSNGHMLEAWSAGAWSPPVDLAAGFGLSDMLYSAPGVAALPSGQVIAFWQGAGGHLHEAWTSGGDWSTPLDAGAQALMS